ANIHAQVLATDSAIGYLIMDLDQDVSSDVCRDVAALTTNITTRMVR
ncbi:MAG: phosphoglycerate dehydrogenase, partial [Polyangiaceae bacterium]